jgi:O-acetyl-ADP-ribose deacetylase (regulator of RNase III)
MGKRVLIAHGCNRQGKMASGFAGIIKKLYPFCYTAYMQEHNDFGLVGGDVVFATSEDSKVVVANCITQDFYGRDGKKYVEYDWVVDAMSKVATYAKQANAPVIFPFIGGGLAGGDRKRLAAIFEAVFHDVDATLYIQD